MWLSYKLVTLSMLQSAGDLQNDEHTATTILQMVQSGGKLMNTLSSERRGNFHRLSGVLLNEANISKSLRVPYY